MNINAYEVYSTAYCPITDVRTIVIPKKKDNIRRVEPVTEAYKGKQIDVRL